METVMSKIRNTSGKFAPKSGTARRVRSVNLTDNTWQCLASLATKAGMSRNDYLESLVLSNNPFMETGKPRIQPFMETVEFEKETYEASTEKQPTNKDLPFMKTVGLAPIAIGVELSRQDLAAEVLNQLRAVRRKATASLADIETILEMMGKWCPKGDIRNNASLTKGFTTGG